MMPKVEDDDGALERAAIGKAVLNLVPDVLRQSMASDPEFLSNFGLFMRTDGTVSFGRGPSFITSALFNAVRKADEAGVGNAVTDKSGQEWSVQIVAGEQGQKCPTLARGEKSIKHFEGSLLLADADVRLFALRQMARDAGLPDEDIQTWRKIVADNALEDRQMMALHEDLEDSPIRFVDRLGTALRSGETPTDMLVPESRRYFERLVGVLGDAATVHDHARGGAAKNAARLIKWDSKDGLLIALSTSSHTEFSAVIPLADVSKETILEVFQLLLDGGDPLSVLGIVQATIPLLDEYSEISSPIVKLVEKVIAGNPELEDSDMSVLSRLFVFVDAEISSKGILRGTPVFYRRMASFAQASLIHRQILIEGADPAHFCKWIMQNYAGQYYSQSLVDMRTAPRWNPDLIHAEQLKQEFMGRLLGSGDTYKKQLGSGRLHDLLSPDSGAQDGLMSLIEVPKPFFPGPLEGAMPPSQELPDDLLSVIDKQLTKKELSTGSFIAAINLANVFLIDTKLSSKISELLKNGRYHLRQVSDVDELAAVLSGLAKIAAVARDGELASDVRVLVRKYRNDTYLKISLPEAYRTLFFGAGAFENLAEWSTFVGEGLEDLAFGELTKNEAEELQAFVQRVCAAEPELWTVTGSASAAIAAFLSS